MLREYERADITSQNTTKLVPAIGQPTRFDQTFIRLLQCAIAEVLNIRPDAVRITSAKKRTVRIAIEFPTDGVDEKEVVTRRENGRIVLIPVSAEDDPIFGLGQSPVACGVTNGSASHDRYIYAPGQ